MDQRLKELLSSGKHFAALSTLGEDGYAHTTVVWVDITGDYLRYNTEVHRVQFKNVERDPRVTVAIWNSDNPYNYVEVKGKVVNTIKGEEAKKHIDSLSNHYTGMDYAMPVQSERVIVEVQAEKIRWQG